MNRTLSIVPMLGAIMLAVAFGYLVGRITTVRLDLPPFALSSALDERPQAAVVEIDGIINGKLEARVKGDVRFFLGDELLLPDASGAVRVPAGPLLVNQVLIQVPPGMQFVASRKGSKYYPVDSAGGSAIVPENRIYFRTEEEARAAGYLL